MGTVPQGDADHLLGDGHLKVQRPPGGVQQHGQAIDVRVRNMTAVLAQVGRDPVGFGAQGDLGRPQGIGQVAAARVPDRRHVVDVDAEPERTDHALSLRLPGSSIGMAASSGGSSSAG